MQSLINQWFEWLRSLDIAGSVARGRSYTTQPDATLKAWAQELTNRNYTNARASAAWVWVTAGQWFGTKRELQFSDLFPTTEQLQAIQSTNLVSVHYHKSAIDAVKVEFEKMLNEQKYKTPEYGEIMKDLTILGGVNATLHCQLAETKQENAKLSQKLTLANATIERLRAHIAANQSYTPFTPDSETLELECNSTLTT